jgi:hypothetical protein
MPTSNDPLVEPHSEDEADKEHHLPAQAHPLQSLLEDRKVGWLDGNTSYPPERTHSSSSWKIGWLDGNTSYPPTWPASAQNRGRPSSPSATTSGL